MGVSLEGKGLEKKEIAGKRTLGGTSGGGWLGKCPG